jgi:linoleoyl-CoA desaturase
MSSAHVTLSPDRLKSLAAALDDVKKRAEERMGDEDVAHVKRLQRLSRTCEVVGRLLIHFSPGPVSFLAGVGALWTHKQLQATEIGHPVLHGCYDKLDGAEKFRSDVWTWGVPIDEEAWHQGHNLRHHGHTNIAGKDLDVNFGPTRLTEHTPHRWFHRVQVPYAVLLSWPNFAWGMNAHFTGLLDLTRPRMDVLPDRSWRSAAKAFRMAFRKYIPYYAYNYVLFPVLAGPLWWKVLLGNWMAEKGRDIYTAASIF